MPGPFGIEPPLPRIGPACTVDKSESNSWAEFPGVFRASRPAFVEHEKATPELKTLMSDGANDAAVHRVLAKRTKSARSSSISSRWSSPMQRSSETIGAIASALATANALRALIVYPLPNGP
jgi:hypothetical protein